MQPLSSYNSQASGLSLIQAIILVVLAYFFNVYDWLILLPWMGIVLFTIVAYFRARMDWVWYGVAASPGMEVWARMTHADYVPNEMGKYYLLLAITVIIAGRLRNSKHSPAHYAGLAFLGILLPSTFVSLATFNYDNWLFNGIGIIELILLLALAAGERWDTERYCRTLQYAALPLIGILVSMTIKTPDYNNMEFLLNANNSGGFGSNQISTLLGAGVAITTILLVLRRPFFNIKLLNYLFIAYMIFRGLLTFSRGGIIVGAIAVIVVLLPVIFSNAWSFIKYSFLLLLLTGIGYGIFNKVNTISGNQLLYRYMGETKGTLERTKARNLNTLTSGRANLVLSDWRIFKDNIVFGIGIGNSKDERVKYGEPAFAPHTEFTRLISEQGLGGGLVAIGLMLFAIAWTFRQRLAVWRGVTAGIFVLAVFTTFHSAMRTNTAAVFYALAAIPVYFYSRHREEHPEA